MKRLLLLSIILSNVAQAQVEDYEHYHKPDSVAHVESIKAFFLKGKIHGHVRNSVMGTINDGHLKNYFANATGGSLSYHTAIWKGFELGVKGIFTYNTFSTDLNDEDTLAHSSAKWEKELFDVNRPEEKKDLDRLEELYLTYHFFDSYVTLGKIDINQGPLLLKRDGRMKPFVYKGIWSELGMLKNHTFNVGWILGVSPRGMTEWYNMNEAIGLLNNGRTVNGQKAHYHEHSNTKGLGVLGYRGQFKHHFKLEVWNYYLHHMYNTSWFQLDYNGEKMFGGIQYVVQVADPYQEKLAAEHRVFEPGTTSNTISAQIGYKIKSSGIKISGAYLRGLGGGERFQFPRELTRENFYVSQPRSWIDGFGKVDVFMLRFYYRPMKEKWNSFSFDTRIERVHAKHMDDYANNKYGIPSFYQSTSILKYSFKRKLEGLSILLLSVFKFSEERDDLEHYHIFYRTNLYHFNIILNIKF